MRVAVARTRPSGSVTVSGEAQVCRNHPPSGCGSRSRTSARGGRMPSIIPPLAPMVMVPAQPRFTDGSAGLGGHGKKPLVRRT